MRWSTSQMYARVLAGDASCNGRFFTGVLTTGIYCLPSCKARKPRPENVRFFPSCEAARAAGLRPCKKCHPDDFARGADPVLEDVEALVAEVRAAPANFADVRAVVRRSGFGATRVFELFRQHFHATPAEVLTRARLEAAKRLLRPADRTGPAGSRTAAESVAAIGYAVGFESTSVFHDQFRAANGLTPGAYRELGDGPSFRVMLPPDYPLPYLRRALSRDAHSLTERLQGSAYVCAVRLGPTPAVLRLELAADGVDVAMEETSPTPARAIAAHEIVVGLLGLEQDAAGFARLAGKLGLARLTVQRKELRLSQTHSLFDAVLWSIIGQQINLPFACLLRRRLIERVSRPLAAGLYAPPTPEEVAALSVEELLPLQFSRQKADYVIATARLIASGALDLAGLRWMSATRVERTLLAVRGLGPWSVNYVMMRALGFADCVPLGDTGVTSGLQALLELEERPDADATRRLMAVFSPYRSLATAHLWQFNLPPL